MVSQTRGLGSWGDEGKRGGCGACPQLSVPDMRVRNQGEDPLEPFGVYDTRTAKEIYEPEEEDSEEEEEPAADPSHPASGWWKEWVKGGERKAEEEEGGDK